MITAAQCEARFGRPGVIFERMYMTLWEVPAPIRERIKALPKKIYCHKLMVEPLTKAFENLILNCVEDELVTWDGCFNIRLMRGLNTMSIHSWALAIDVNAKTNALGAKPTLSKTFVKCFTDAGFDWGGTWTRKDGMHFQLSCI